MKNILIKSGITGLSVLTLVASGTTGTGTTVSTATEFEAIQTVIIIDNAKDTINGALKAVKLKKDGSNITFTKGGKTYNLTSADIQTDKSYEKISGTETLQLQNLSTTFLEDNFKYKTNDVDLWWADVNDTGTQIHDSGYFVVGTKSSSIPTSSTATYTGAVAGRYITNDADVSTLAGKTSVTVNFSTNKVTGSISNILMIDIITKARVNDPNTYTFTNGLLASDVTSAFTANLTSSGGALTGTSVIGEFYGTEGAEIGGFGSFTDSGGSAIFAFTAKK